MNVLLCGLGGMGRVHYANSVLIPDIHICAAVGSGEKDRAEAESHSLPFFSSISEAFAALPGIDAVDITTPTFLHRDHIMEAIAAGAGNIIAEKPLALSSRDAEEIYSAAEAAGARIVPAHVMRFTKEFRVLREAVSDCRYGAVLDASFSRISSMPLWSNGWLLDRSRSGAVPFDLHIHDLDMIFALFGKPASVTSYKRRSRESSVDEYFHVSYGYDGFSVNAEAAWLRASVPFSASWRVIFEHGVLQYDGDRVMAFPDGGEPSVLDTHYDRIVSTGINVPPTGWYYEELSAIYSYLSSAEERPFIPYQDIVEELKILENL